MNAPRELIVAVAKDDGKVAGAFGFDEERLPRLLRRGSGGPTLNLAIESVYVALNLERAAVLDPAIGASRVINRAVRPLLRALKKCGITAAMYGDRDFVAAKGMPLAWVGFQHDAVTGRAAFEAVIGVAAPFEISADAPRTTFRGRAPTSLRDLKCTLAGSEMAMRIADAYTAEFSNLVALDRESISADQETSVEVGELFVEDDVIGKVGIRKSATGRSQIVGDFQASRDFVTLANDALSRASNQDEASAAIDLAANAEHVVVFGLASLDALKRAAARAFASSLVPEEPR